MNSLNLAQMNGYGVGHIDHPGTPVQFTGAIVIKILHVASGQNSDIVNDVLLRPEYYLSKINLMFIFMTGLALFIVGMVTYKKTGDIYAALLLQLTPFFTSTVYDHFTDVSSESLFIVAILLFLAAVISFEFEENILLKNSFKYLIIFGTVCGFGLACKIIFFPLLLIPIILINRNSHRFLFTLITVISFLVFVFPALSSENSAKYINWITGIATHTGKYGTGQQAVIESATYLENFKKNLLYDVSFILSYSAVVVIFILQFFSKFKKTIRSSPHFRLLCGIFLSMTAQIFLVAKQYDPRYMIPVYMLSVLGLLTASLIAKDILSIRFGKRWFIYLSMIIVFFSCFRLFTIFKEYSEYRHSLEESLKLNNFLEKNYKESILIKSNIKNNLQYSLNFGADWAGTQEERYRLILRNLYPDFFYYHRYAKDFYLTDLGHLAEKLQSTNKIIFQSDDKKLIDGFITRLKNLYPSRNGVYKEIFSNENGESVYEISLEPK